MKDNGPGSLDEYVINNCMVTMIRDYGILTVDINTWACNNIALTNSTFSKIRAFITSKNNTETVTIEGCSFSETPSAGQRMFRWREAGQDNVTGGIMVKNTLWGTGWDELAEGSTGYDGFDGLAATTWAFENTYKTSDLEFSADTIEGINFTYDGLSTALWSDLATGDLNYADTTFDGIGNAGDQRWSNATEDGGLEWNISAAAFANLGTIAATQKVAGLDIIANSDKTITIDGNSKTVGDMSFTSRLKLGGSASFDENGQPLGRVLSIDVKGNTGITVAAMSSSSSSDRVLNIAAGHKDSIIAEFPAMGAELTKGQYTYLGGATKLYFYSPSSGVNVYYIKTGHIVGTDATLSGLSVNTGTFSPDFDATVTTYTVVVPAGTTSVSVSATATDPLATVDGAGDVNVSSGSGTATVTVTAEDGTTTMVYTVNITVEANNDASLSALSISAGILDPFFDATTMTYSVVLPEGTTSVTVTATANDPNATVTGAGDIDVSSGSGTATIVVTAEDGTTELTYTINFTVPTGIGEAQQKSMSVYPTLSNGTFNIEFTSNPGMITVYDLTGNKVLERNASSLIETIQIDKSGIFMIRLECGNEIQIVRVISAR